MLRNWIGVLCCVVFLSTWNVPLAQAEGAGETLLPDTTRGFISLTNFDDLVEHWNETQLSKLLRDPVMEPFSKDVRRQLEERWSDIDERIGLSLKDLEGVPGGEVSLAVSSRNPNGTAELSVDQIGLILLVDVTGNLHEAHAMLDKVAKKLTATGATRSVRTVGPASVTVFNLPKRSETGLQRQAIYFIEGNLLVVSDRYKEVAEVIGRLGGKTENSLATVPAFQAVMKRCQKDAGERKPQVRWFVDPIGYLEIVRANSRDRHQRSRKGKSMLEVIKNQGFGAMRGIGGFFDLTVDGYEMLNRVSVFAPPPYTNTMKMLVFPNGKVFAPQPWVPRDIASFSTGNCDILNAFDQCGPVFDELFGQGEEDVLPQVLDGLKNNPDGPQINLRAELIEQLANRITVLTDYELPITTTSERLLFAIELNDEKATIRAIRKLFKDDDELRIREFHGHIIWEAIPKLKTKGPVVTVELPSLNLGEEEEEEEDEETERFFPNTAITVAHGQLMISSHLDFLLKILDLPKKGETLATDVQYRVIEATSKKLGAGEDCARIFSRTDEAYRPTYELIRQGKMPEAETLLGRVLNSVFAVNRKGQTRKQQIDGSRLPDYDFVRRYLGPAGFFATSEPDGWFFKSFTLAKPK